MVDNLPALTASTITPAPPVLNRTPARLTLVPAGGIFKSALRTCPKPGLPTSSPGGGKYVQIAVEDRQVCLARE